MKYYRVVKDTFLWNKGAILKLGEDLGNGEGGYMPIEDIWNANDSVPNEYINAKIIEASPEWFERVYADNLEKMVFKTKAQMKESFSKFVS